MSPDRWSEDLALAGQVLYDVGLAIVASCSCHHSSCIHDRIRQSVGDPLDRALKAEAKVADLQAEVEGERILQMELREALTDARKFVSTLGASGRDLHEWVADVQRRCDLVLSDPPPAVGPLVPTFMEFHKHWRNECPDDGIDGRGKHSSCFADQKRLLGELCRLLGVHNR